VEGQESHHGGEVGGSIDRWMEAAAVMKLVDGPLERLR
jgi:hypothetical protein